MFDIYKNREAWPERLSNDIPYWAVTGIPPNKVDVNYVVRNGRLWGWFDIDGVADPRDEGKTLKELLDANEGQVFWRPGYYNQQFDGYYYYQAYGGYPNSLRGCSEDRRVGSWKRLSLRSLLIQKGFSSRGPYDPTPLEKYFYDDTADPNKVLQWHKEQPESNGDSRLPAYWNWCFIQDAPEK